MHLGTVNVKNTTRSPFWVARYSIPEIPSSWNFGKVVEMRVSRRKSSSSSSECHFLIVRPMAKKKNDNSSSSSGTVTFFFFVNTVFSFSSTIVHTVVVNV
ncbi:hypothetical protein CFOL_v3_28416 [Cephalotus follicularis]|uniref:Uncharacterized protein n=1 Tax=Cephalotus follicularis TaxID=3775 RepID=A0A1Q3CXJ6_CEPFO|nr:hypothetical protein CFOL_v3_28416 [Cephalotus follicularis]